MANMNFQAQLLTAAEFAKAVTVTKLLNHGRKWQVSGPAGFSSFSDAGTPADALVDAHRAEVNNALYFQLADSPKFDFQPDMPPAHVLALYPDVVARFPELNLSPACKQFTLL